MTCEDFQCILEHNFSPFDRKAVVGGMSAGAIGQFFASPTDLVKVQMQMEGKRKLEGKPLRLVPLTAGGFFPCYWSLFGPGCGSLCFLPPLLPSCSVPFYREGTRWLWAVKVG